MDPSTNETHPIDGVNLWPFLVAGDGGGVAPPRQWLPTTERSLLWDDGEGHVYKLVVDEFQANRFNPNGTQYMDDANKCLPASSESEQRGAATTTASSSSSAAAVVLADPGLQVPKSCTVCTNTTPCLFDVVADPEERNNMAVQLPSVLAKMQSKLTSYVPYVPAQLTPEQLACYNCSTAASKQWGSFVSPCCVRNSSSSSSSSAQEVWAQP